MNFDFLEKKPRCFGDFELVDPEIGDKSADYFVRKFVVCKCGSDILSIHSSYGSGMYLAPILLECPQCTHKALVFDPEMHGWDGENGDNCSMVGSAEPSRWPESPSRVMVEFSFQGIENYQDLQDAGVENVEDYFDTFNLYAIDPDGNIAQSIDYECA